MKILFQLLVMEYINEEKEEKEQLENVRKSLRNKLKKNIEHWRKKEIKKIASLFERQ